MITMEQIDEFRKRTNSSYGDAKYFLEKNNGDVLEAIIDFERTKTGRFNGFNKKKPEDLAKRLTEILQKGFDIRLMIKDRDKVLFTVPVLLLIILIPLWPIVMLFFVFLAAIGYKFSIQELKDKSFDVGDFLNNINSKLKQNHTQGANERQPGQNCSNPASDKGQEPQDMDNNVAPSENIDKSDDIDDEKDYNEYTVE